MSNPIEQAQQALSSPGFVDKFIGAVLSLLGGSGITYQVIEQTLSITVLLVNLLLGLGGLWMMFHRNKKAKG